MSSTEDILALQQLVARFANSFDTKDWACLEQCLKAELHTGYSDPSYAPAACSATTNRATSSGFSIAFAEHRRSACRAPVS